MHLRIHSCTETIFSQSFYYWCSIIVERKYKKKLCVRSIHNCSHRVFYQFLWQTKEYEELTSVHVRSYWIALRFKINATVWERETHLHFVKMFCRTSTVLTLLFLIYGNYIWVRITKIVCTSFIYVYLCVEHSFVDCCFHPVHNNDHL